MSDEEYIANKVPGRIYGSKAFKVKQATGIVDGKLKTTERTLRYLDRVFPEVDGPAFATVKGELVLKPTPSGKRQVKLCIIEDPRKIRSLVLQNFSLGETGELPSKKSHFALHGQEIDDLLEIAGLACNGDFRTSDKFRIGVNQLQRIDLTSEAIRALIGANIGALEEILKHEITKKDIVAIAYRKDQLRRFENLLRDREYFRNELETTAGQGPEKVWQRFFEDNHWIFGGSLFFTATGPIDKGRLERVVAGSSVAHPGKVVDGLLRTRGRVSALCFVEIKTPETPLLAANMYREGVWPPSKELIGAIAQLQRTVQLAQRDIGEVLQPIDQSGNPTEPEAHFIRPRSVVICGNLAAFVTPSGMNKEKYSCFELFRRHLQGPEVLTFDEVLERAKLLLDPQSHEE